MSTKPPAGVAAFPAEALEKIAYAAVADIETEEPNDRSRLGYNVWAWLKERRGTLEQAVRSAGTRTKLPIQEVYVVVSRRLQEQGVDLK